MGAVLGPPFELSNQAFHPQLAVLPGQATALDLLGQLAAEKVEVEGAQGLAQQLQQPRETV